MPKAPGQCGDVLGEFTRVVPQSKRHYTQKDLMLPAPQRCGKVPQKCYCPMLEATIATYRTRPQGFLAKEVHYPLPQSIEAMCRKIFP